MVLTSQYLFRVSLGVRVTFRVRVKVTVRVKVMVRLLLVVVINNFSLLIS